jgi:hypothetical protein
MQGNVSTCDAMFSMIRRWQSSGMKKLQFCKEENIQYHNFHYWYKKFSNTNKTTQSKSTARFVSVNTIMSEFSGGFAEISVPDGRRLVIQQPVSAEYLKTLIQ